MTALSEQTILVTGATDGLGRQVAINLAQRGAAVLCHGRSAERGATVLSEISASTKGAVARFYRAEFTSLEEVRALAADLSAREKRIDVVINNAGLGIGEPGESRSITRDGYESRFQVNYLAPYLLTHALLPLLERAQPARIVNVASVGQAPIDFDDVMLEHKYSGTRAYSQSKVAQIMFTFDLAKELESTRVTVSACIRHRSCRRRLSRERGLGC